MGQMHAVTLQLLAKGIIELTVTNRTKIGTPKLKVTDVTIKTANVNIVWANRTYYTPAYAVDKYWEGIQLLSDN